MKLSQVRKLALSLPGATEEPHFNRVSFRVGGRIFVTARPDDSHIHVFVPEDVRASALAIYPDQVSKLLWGGKVVGLRVELSTTAPRVVRDLVEKAWQSKTKKNVAATPKHVSAGSAACEKVRAFCLSLPDTVETSSWGHPNFRVGKTAFVTLETHQGRPSIAFRLVADQVQSLCGESVFFQTRYGKGLWASTYADRRMNWRFIQGLIRQSYKLAVPVPHRAAPARRGAASTDQ